MTQVRFILIFVAINLGIRVTSGSRRGLDLEPAFAYNQAFPRSRRTIRRVRLCRGPGKRR